MQFSSTAMTLSVFIPFAIGAAALLTAFGKFGRRIRRPLLSVSALSALIAGTSLFYTAAVADPANVKAVYEKSVGTPIQFEMKSRIERGRTITVRQLAKWSEGLVSPEAVLQDWLVTESPAKNSPIR